MMATAPATVTVFPPELESLSEVSALALLVSVVEDVLPVLACCCWLAFLSWSSALPLTSLPEVSSPLPLAPVALASASVVLAEEPLAESVTLVPLRVRESVAETSSSAMSSASARPITTVPLTALALAVVVVLVVWDALRLTAPVAGSVCAVPPAMRALVVTVASVIAASAVSPRVEPAAPAVPASA